MTLVPPPAVDDYTRTSATTTHGAASGVKTPPPGVALPPRHNSARQRGRVQPLVRLLDVFRVEVVRLVLVGLPAVPLVLLVA